MKKGLLIGCSIPIILIIGLVIYAFISAIVDTTTNNEGNKDTEKSVEEQKEYYLKEIQPQIEKFKQDYDKIWVEGWQPTLEALSNSNVNVYAAYENLKVIKETYRSLSLEIDNITTDGLSEENKKKLKSGLTNLKYAAVSRQMAAEKAMDMVDENNYSPSHMEKIKKDISSSDSNLLSSVSTILSLEKELGIVAAQEKNTEQ